MALSKSAVISTLAERSGLTKKQVTNLFDLLEVLAVEEAQNVFVVPNLGRLVLSDRKARTGRNPKTGQPVEIPAKRVVKFRISKGIKDAVLAQATAI